MVCSCISPAHSSHRRYRLLGLNGNLHDNIEIAVFVRSFINSVELATCRMLVALRMPIKRLFGATYTHLVCSPLQSLSLFFRPQHVEHFRMHSIFYEVYDGNVHGPCKLHFAVFSLKHNRLRSFTSLFYNH